MRESRRFIALQDMICDCHKRIYFPVIFSAGVIIIISEPDESVKAHLTDSLLSGASTNRIESII